MAWSNVVSHVGGRISTLSTFAGNAGNGKKGFLFATGSVAFSTGVGLLAAGPLGAIGGFAAGLAAGFGYGAFFGPNAPSTSPIENSDPRPEDNSPPHGPWTPPGLFPDPHPDLDLDDDLPLNTSPLILDLDGDGVEAGAAVFFDHEGDGFMELTRWVGEDDGMLVWDRNGDGVINDGSELFGNNTVLANGEKAANGFAALAELDSNGDGVVNSQDENFADLRVMRWMDANDNGMMDDGEERLETLAAAGVQSLNTAFVNSDKVDEHGNEHRQVGSFTKMDDTTAERNFAI